MIEVELNQLHCIHPDYSIRARPEHFDDREQRDLYQDEVYRYARKWADINQARRIVDFGCGSGFKLMKYFSGFETVGYEIEPSLTHLRRHYPDREWRDARLPVQFVGDLLICADVIEHMDFPVWLMGRIKEGPIKNVVLSTPALEILSERGESPRLGPPDNRSHVREWTTREFFDFVEMHLRVLDHLVVSTKQGTQLILAERK